MNEKGLVQVLVLLLLLLGIVIGVYLVQHRTNPLPFAHEATFTDSSTTAGSPVKIMPLGDSITWGVMYGGLGTDPSFGGYRTYLWNKLIAGGYSFNFVGSQISGPDSLPERNHEGHSGYGIGGPNSLEQRQLYKYVDRWLDQSQPDIILLMVGVNDIARDIDVANMPNRLGDLIDKITLKLPNTRLLVASIPPTDIGVLDIAKKVEDYNNAIPTIVATKLAQGKNVTFVDIYHALTLADISDRVHPNEQGYQKIAELWYQALIKLNPSLPKQPITPPSPTSNEQGPIYFWHMDEASGNTVVDSVGGNNGTAIGTGIVDGKIGNARLFSGTSDMIQTIDSHLGFFDMSVSAWIYPASSGEVWNWIVSQWRDASFGAWNLSYSTDYRLYFHTRNNCGEKLGDIFSNGRLAPAIWHQVVATRNGTTGMTKLYIDGQLDNATTLPAGQICGVYLPITLGRSPWDPTQRMVGKLDEVAIWNRELSQAEVLKLYSH